MSVTKKQIDSAIKHLGPEVAAKVLPAATGYESMTKEERQKRLDEHGITEQDLYESRQAEREAMLTAIHS